MQYTQKLLAILLGCSKSVITTFMVFLHSYVIPLQSIMQKPLCQVSPRLQHIMQLFYMSYRSMTLLSNIHHAEVDSYAHCISLPRVQLESALQVFDSEEIELASSSHTG